MKQRLSPDENWHYKETCGRCNPRRCKPGRRRAVPYFDILDGLLASEIFVPGRIFTLGGQYEFTAQGVAAEIQLTEAASGRRSVIYLSAGERLFLFVPPGQYRFRLRLFSVTANARIRARKLSLLSRLGFLAAKLASVLRRPKDWPALARTMMRRRTGIIGARLKAATPAMEMPPRPVPVADAEPATGDVPVSIIIPTKYRPELISACVASLDLDPRPKDIIIIDNGSMDADMRLCLADLAQRPDTRVLRHDIPFNFSRLCNLGAAAARHDWLLFLNDDVEALDGSWLGAMLGYAAQPGMGVVGARLLYPSRDLQHGGIASHLVPGPGHPWRGLPQAQWRDHPVLSVAGETDAVTAACLMIGKALFDQVSGFDETHFAITLNDVDLCLKVRAAGLKIVYVPQATLLHKEGQSRRADDSPQEAARREAELKVYVQAWPEQADASQTYPYLRRDTDRGQGLPL